MKCCFGIRDDSANTASISILMIDVDLFKDLNDARASVITLNPAIRDRVKSGHRRRPKT
jgi:hypothetical protein